jgi:NADPH:quinone reductase-like Zn-dependent oxidoreductase
MPSQQKALFLPEAKGQWTIGSKEIPTPGPGEVLVQIQAAGLNLVDWYIQATGMIVEKYPAIIGFDAGSIVKQVGNGVTNVAVGDRV